MSARLYIATCACLASLLMACEKPEVNNPSRAFLKYIPVSELYLARGAVAMPDGSTIVGSVGFENASNPSAYGILPALLTKLDERGEIIWQVELPQVVHELWECQLLRNGNLLVIGFESFPFPERAGMAILSPDGEVLFSRLVPNQTFSGFPQITRASITAKELITGEIALVMPTVTQINTLTRLRLIRFDQQLEPIENRVYEPNMPLPSTKGMGFPRMQEDVQGNLIILMALFGPRNQPNPEFAAVVKLKASTYDPEYIQFFTPAEEVALPSSLAINSLGEAIWVSGDTTVQATGNIFNLRHQEHFRLSRNLIVWKTNGNKEDTKTNVIGGYPKLGYIQTVAPCSDGGFILAGTCNINEDQRIPSAFQIMLIKLNASLELEWLRIPDTNTPSFGAQAVEIPGGFLVTASNAPDQNVVLPFVFKTNGQGIIQ